MFSASVCVCDNDNSGTLDMNELGSNHCSVLQNWILGQLIDGNLFAMADTNGNGFVDEPEGISAIEFLLNNDI